MLKDATVFVLAVSDTFEARAWAELADHGMIA
jgi:hypothetical protein